VALVTTSEAGARFGVTRQAVNNWVRRYGIEGTWITRTDIRGREHMVRGYSLDDLLRAERRARQGRRLGEAAV
jgi:hypothetical protein